VSTGDAERVKGGRGRQFREKLRLVGAGEISKKRKKMSRQRLMKESKLQASPANG